MTYKNLAIFFLCFVVMTQWVYIHKVDQLNDQMLNKMQSSVNILEEQDKAVTDATASLNEYSSTINVQNKELQHCRERVKMLTTELRECTPQL